jgi:hypothetical protein
VKFDGALDLDSGPIRLLKMKRVLYGWSYTVTLLDISHVE